MKAYGIPVELSWQGKTEVQINRSWCPFLHHEDHMVWPETERGSPRWEAGD
jgi:hypothetical protein